MVARTISARVHVVRHGQALHNIDRSLAHRDPPLTHVGHEGTERIAIAAVPDLVLISPMTRTIQTAVNMFPDIGTASSHIEVQIWPDLREAHDAVCNKGVSRADMLAKYPHLDFSTCSKAWDYPPHTMEAATSRTESVRARLKELSKPYNNIVLVTHRGSIAFLVKGDRYEICETRSYRFGTDEEAGVEPLRYGVNVDTMAWQDYGPTMLVPDPSIEIFDM